MVKPDTSSLSKEIKTRIVFEELKTWWCRKPMKTMSYVYYAVDSNISFSLNIMDLGLLISDWTFSYC